MSNTTGNIKTTLCIVGLLFSQLMISAQSNELAMVENNTTFTPVNTPYPTGPERLTYEITDNSGKAIATGQLNRNTSLAVNVAMGTYTLRISGGGQPVTQKVVLNEPETVSPISNSSITSGYIVVKVDNNGSFTYQKMVL